MVKIKSHKGRVVTDVRGTESEIFADMMTAIYTFFKDLQEDALSPEMYYALEKRFVALILSGHVLQGGGDKIDRIMQDLQTIISAKDNQKTIDDETVEHPIT